MLALLLMPALNAFADNNRDGRPSNDNTRPARGQSVTRAPQARQPVVINMSRGSSGGHNRNYPSQQPSRPAAQPESRPSYGRLNWSAPVEKKTQTQTQLWTPARRNSGQVNRSTGQTIPRTYERPNVKAYASPGIHAAVAVHHHAYTPGYVRGKLRKIGVTAEPSLITDRAEIIHTDRLHSAIGLPKEGPGHRPLRGNALSPRHFNDPIVRQQMARIDNADWTARIHGFHDSEKLANHYYWHQDQGFNFCHYIDPTGYHWWGWYSGDQFFWTRHFHSRWWWYDSDYDRWCFWNNGNWWWQDPYHLGDLYCYNNDTYIPTNSADDQVVVTAPVNSNPQVTTSPDGTRLVKVIGDSQDAFLYDTANPPTFDPVYLASGTQSVQFSDTSNGRPLEIILKLNDGSFDMFDGYGNPYNPGANDNDQADPGGADSGQPPQDSGPPPHTGDNGPADN